MSENPNPVVIEMRGVSAGAMRDITFPVAEDVNWTVAPGEFWVIAGQQHSGKTDFLMLTAGLMAPVKGSYNLFGNEMPMPDEVRAAQRRRLGFVFENGQLFNRLTLGENVALPVQYHRDLTDAAAGETVRELFELMGLYPLADLTPANVSANWLKRAGLARALILQPEVLLLDNPLRGLDAQHTQWWLRFLDALCRGHEWFGGRPMTVIATTDDLRPWQNGTRRFVLLNDKKFRPAGSWAELEAADDLVAKELLAVPI